MRTVAFLLTLSIFGSVAQARADSVKSMNNDANQLTMMKMDENKVVIQKKTEPTTEPTQSLKKSKAKFQVGNFLRTLEEQKSSQWLESLYKVIYSHDFSHYAWTNGFLNSWQVTETRSSTLEVGQSALKPNPDGNGYSEEGRLLTTLRLLQSKREETFKDLFMGFRFSFDLMNGHVFLEMSVAPSFKKGSGFIIRF